MESSVWVYLRQTPPISQPRVFATEQICHQAHSAPTFSPDGTEVYWSTVRTGDDPRRIIMMQYREGEWTAPQVAPFSGNYDDDHPFLSFDGQTVYFASRRPAAGDGPPTAPSLWRVTRSTTGWGVPQRLEAPIYSEGVQWTPSLTRSGDLYFMDGELGICKVAYENGQFQTKMALPPAINLPSARNWGPFIDPDERYLLFASDRAGGVGSDDLYVSFSLEEGQWTEPINLGEPINTARQERFPGMSPDGKYLFFTRWYGPPAQHDLYWVEVGILEDLRE